MKKTLLITLLIIITSTSSCSLFRNRFKEDKNLPEPEMIEENFDLNNKITSGSGEIIQSGSGKIISKIPEINHQTELDLKRKEKVIEKLKSENETLTNSLQSLEIGPVSAKNIIERNTVNQIKYNSCGTFNSYSSFNWVNDLNSLLEQQKFPFFQSEIPTMINTDEIISSCYSSNGELFIMLISTGPEFLLLRYDLKYQSLQAATLTTANTNKLPSPQHFGKRLDNKISLSGFASEENCQIETKYLYDFVNNTLSIQEKCRNCAGQPESCT